MGNGPKPAKGSKAGQWSIGPSDGKPEEMQEPQRSPVKDRTREISEIILNRTMMISEIKNANFKVSNP